ncbi:MAG: RNA polymerase sigma-70 factor [Tannerellaceae bacterium]|nr:RNA polymerase sigma-70 factor [Tannerellaceae bacterium]
MKNLDLSNFNQFYTRYYKRSFLFAKSYVHNDMVAEDIASEALIKLWEMVKTKEIENPQTILYIILKHKALDYLKQEVIKENVLHNLSDYGKRELEIRISTLEATNPEKIFARDILQIIQATISQLPEQTQQIFKMSRFKNLSKKEIADNFQISVKGVEYHLSKAVVCLRENLKDYFSFIPPALFILFNIY